MVRAHGWIIVTKRKVKIRLIMEAEYEIDPESSGYGVATLDEAVEIDRKALYGEKGVGVASLAMDAIDPHPVGFEWEEIGAEVQ